MKPQRLDAVLVVALGALLFSSATAGSSPRHPRLPYQAPAPIVLQRASEQDTVRPADVPIPTPRPDNARGRTDQGQPSDGPHKRGDALSGPQAPHDGPVPEDREDARSGAETSALMPADEVACRKDLTALGAEFSDAPAQFSAEGCSLPYPVILKDVGAGISLTPPAVLDCAMAEAVTRFATGPMETRLKATYGQGLKSISQASAYVCRPRAGTLRLSEHAFGNALDIGALVLQDGTVLSVGSALPDKETVVLQQIRNDACGPFKTVLGPGSDPDHASHLHLDLAPRRHGGLYCQ